MPLMYFIISDKNCGLLQLCYRRRQKSEISINVSQVSFQRLQFIRVIKYTSCNFETGEAPSLSSSFTTEVQI
jgi:hypothetical protein